MTRCGGVASGAASCRRPGQCVIGRRAEGGAAGTATGATRVLGGVSLHPSAAPARPARPDPAPFTPADNGHIVDALSPRKPLLAQRLYRTSAPDYLKGLNSASCPKSRRKSAREPFKEMANLLAWDSRKSGMLTVLSGRSSPETTDTSRSGWFMRISDMLKKCRSG